MRNEVLEFDGFYISYNPHPVLIPAFDSDDKQPETALVANNLFYILNGDFRAEYKELGPKGFEACLEFFRAKEPEHGSSWTTPSVNRRYPS